MTSKLLAAVDQIRTGLDALRAALIETETPEQQAAPAPAPSVFKMKPSYTARQAALEKERIEAAFTRGELTYDKKRGLKMMVTKATKAGHGQSASSG